MTFLFDIIFINQPYINDTRKGKSIEITIPKIASYLQIPTIQLNKLSDNSYEDELLLPKSTELKVNKRYKENGMEVIECEVV